VEFLLADTAPGDARHEDLLEIRRAAERARDLTRQLLMFSRRQVVQARRVDLNALVADAERMLRRLIGEDVRLTTSLDPDAPAVHADPGQLEQALLNLGLNARDAIAERGTFVVEIEHEEAADGVVIRVADTGAGMDEETRLLAFEPFFTTKPDGSGLGLASVRGIIEQCGGTVELASTRGLGTTVTLRLPRALEGLPSAAPAAGSDGSEQILLVEDNAVVRSLLAEELEGDGYTVHVAATGDEALQIAETRPVDLVVTDVMMPHMTGAELARRVAERWPDTRLLFISGHTEETLGREGVFDSGIRFLQKPFSLTTLRLSVREALQQPV
jgi:CheY-like chemotaxis protein